MKTIYTKMLKKFTIKDIEEMRQMKREDWSDAEIGIEFDCASTTAMWHTGDIPYYNTRKFI